MKIVIDIPEKTNAHIRSDYGHGVMSLRNEDMEKLCYSVYHGKPYEERQRGKWIKGKEISRMMMADNLLHIDYKDFTCSACGLVLDRLLYHIDGSLFYQFCPNCGTPMTEEAFRKYNGL